MLIEIEGPSGAGKTSLVATLCANPRLGGQTIVNADLERVTGDIGWQLGELMRHQDRPIEPVEKVFLYCARTAARARLVLAHDDRAVVLCDRLRLSLQVATRRAGLPEAACQLLVDLALRGVQPDIVILLDVSHRAHSRRLAARGNDPEPARAFELTRRLFTAAYERHVGPKALIDTTELTPDQVGSAVAGHLSPTRSRA